jgi:hypothetical protein
MGTNKEIFILKYIMKKYINDHCENGDDELVARFKMVCY